MDEKLFDRKKLNKKLKSVFLSTVIISMCPQSKYVHLVICYSSLFKNEGFNIMKAKREKIGF